RGEACPRSLSRGARRHTSADRGSGRARARRDHALLLRRRWDRAPLPRSRAPGLVRGAGDLSQAGCLAGGGAVRARGPAVRRDRLSVPAAAAPPRQAQRARVSRDHRGARRRAARRAPRRPGRANVRQRAASLVFVSGAALRDVALYLRGKLIKRLTQLANARDRTPPVVPAPIDDVIRGVRTPQALSRLLEGRTNRERELAMARYLREVGIPFVAHPFACAEGSGESYTVELGTGDRVLLLAAHHDAVPGSPGANDNAASVGLLLTLIERLAASPPRA